MGNIGIQKSSGGCTDERSRKIDDQCRLAREILKKEFEDKGFICKKTGSKIYLNGNSCYKNFTPDGGIWFDREGKCVAIFEAKKQNAIGNAHERWATNWIIAKALYGEDVPYITFCTGTGYSLNKAVYHGKRGDRCRLPGSTEHALSMLNTEPGKKDVNVLYQKGQSWFLREEGFTNEEIYLIMKKSIIREIQ